MNKNKEKTSSIRQVCESNLNEKSFKTTNNLLIKKIYRNNKRDILIFTHLPESKEIWLRILKIIRVLFGLVP